MSKEDIRTIGRIWGEKLMAERDEARAEVERLREECNAARVALPFALLRIDRTLELLDKRLPNHVDYRDIRAALTGVV